MHNEIVETLTKDFESSAQQTQEGIEFWLARDLQKLLEYNEWRNFSNAIDKAKISCKNSGHKVSDHFAVQTRKLEIIQQRLLESERLSARKKLTETEKELSKVIFEQTGSDKNFRIHY